MISRQSPSFLLCSFFLLASTIGAAAKGTGHGATVDPRVARNPSKSPLSFEINEGQTDARVKFLSHGFRSTLFLTVDELVMALGKGHAEETLDKQTSPRKLGKLAHPMKYSVLRMKLIGANLHAKVAAQSELPGKTNYLLGNDPKKWHTNVANYARVKYTDIYPGVDVMYYGNHLGHLEYDFVVKPGADPTKILLQFVGANRITVNARGSLEAEVGAEIIMLQKPVTYQRVGTGVKSVSGRYVVTGGDRVSFDIGRYDSQLPLIIDPVLQYSTYLGGSDTDIGIGIAADRFGNAYVTGDTLSTDFPTTSGAYDQTYNGSGSCYHTCTPIGDVFVTKISPDGSSLIYSTYVGGSGDDYPADITVDSRGEAIVVGVANACSDLTCPHDFPTTPGSYEPSVSDDTRSAPFIFKLNQSGSALAFSTYFDQTIYAVASDAKGHTFVVGQYFEGYFPITQGAFQPLPAGGVDAFLAAINPSGAAVLLGTFLGGTGGDVADGVAVDSQGSIWLSGYTDSTDFPTVNPYQATNMGSSDTFVSKFNRNGSQLLYSTYLGGSGWDFASRIKTDSNGFAYVVGSTTSPDFPTKNALQPQLAGLWDIFLAKLSGSGDVQYSTYFGGVGDDFAVGVATDRAGRAYIAGNSSIGPESFFVTAFSASGQKIICEMTLGGSSGSGISVNRGGFVYVTGNAGPADFPVTPGAFQTTFGGGSADGFVSQIACP